MPKQHVIHATGYDHMSLRHWVARKECGKLFVGRVRVVKALTSIHHMYNQ